MGRKTDTVIIAYNGLDGACAAAAASIRFPSARILVSSARSVAQTFEMLGKEPEGLAEIHVCGLGVYCDWGDFERAAKGLGSGRTKIIWYCGRGYLDEQRDVFATVCEPIFLDAWSNTEAVCRHLGLKSNPQAAFLSDLARNDPQIGLGEKDLSEEMLFWIDLVSASFAEYAKYHDVDRYVATIRKLAEGRHDAADRRLVAVYRQTGFRYAMQGRSPELRRVQKQIRKCADVDDPILILGESGVGKEHVAHLIHERGSRAAEPFVTRNCAGFAGNEGLANAALFGHCKGAFTGALSDRAGAFRTADRGILFLDELGQLPLEVQGKLLRVLEDGLVTPEGADKPVDPVDVRVIAATNTDLPAMIRRNEFRADLFYRLATLRIVVPPLRDRREDIDVILEHALEQLGEEGRPRKLTRAERQQLHEYDWPGNVRQLRQVLRRAVLMEMPVSDALAEDTALGNLSASESKGTEDILPNSIDDIRPIKVIQQLYAQRALSLHGGSLRQTALALGVAVNTLRTWLKQK
jgi:DNA-binding NtrC family response regulator